MQQIFKKIISTLVIIGIISGTGFFPFLVKAQALMSYEMVVDSATDTSITLTIKAKNTNPQNLDKILVEYADNVTYLNSKTINAGFNNTQQEQTQTKTISGLTSDTTYSIKLIDSGGNALVNSITHKTEVTQPGAPQNPTAQPESSAPVLGSCWEGFNSGFSFPWCVANGFYYLFFVPTSFLFALTGQLMDFSMGFTLNSANYGKTTTGDSFVEKGWTITRDLSNILFIIILMWIAINMILGISKDKKLLVNIILVGLLINFSLFFARIVIDVSNILAKIFYDNMEVATPSIDGFNPNAWLSQGDKSLSVAIVDNVNPQVLFKESQSIKVNTGDGLADTGDTGATSFIIVTLIMSAVNLLGMYIFLVVALAMFGRVAGLWIVMIFAPVAFISYLLPDGAKEVIKEMHHSKWWDSLIKQSLMVPVFLFFLYLILLFLKTGFLKGFGQFDHSTFGVVLNVTIPLIVLVVLLNKAKTIAVEMSGEIGGALAKVGAAVGGLALGGALGAYGKLGRATVGRVGQRIADSETMMNMQRRGGLTGWAAGQVRTGAKATGSASFDARGISGVTNAMKGANITGTGSAAKDGFRGSVERQQKRQKETADELIKGSINDKTNQDTRRARRNLDVLLQTHGVELSSKEEELEDARKKFKQAKDDGAKEGTDEYNKAKTAVDEAKAAVKDFKDKNGISQAGKELGQVETARKREEEKRRRGQAQEIEATKPKNEQQMKETLAKKKELEVTLEAKKSALQSMKEVAEELEPGSDSYTQAQKQISKLEKEVNKTQDKINKVSYSKKNIFSRLGRRISSGGEYGQTGAYETADNQRKGLKDEKKGDNKK